MQNTEITWLQFAGGGAPTPVFPAKREDTEKALVARSLPFTPSLRTLTALHKAQKRGQVIYVILEVFFRSIRLYYITTVRDTHACSLSLSFSRSLSMSVGRHVHAAVPYYIRALCAITYHAHSLRALPRRKLICEGVDSFDSYIRI